MTISVYIIFRWDHFISYHHNQHVIDEKHSSAHADKGVQKHCGTHELRVFKSNCTFCAATTFWKVSECYKNL